MIVQLQSLSFTSLLYKKKKKRMGFSFKPPPVIEHMHYNNAVHQTGFDCVREMNVPACLWDLDFYFFKGNAFLH